MKAIKYVMMGALMLGIGTPAFAQTGDPKADTEAITKMIKNKAGDLAEQSKKYAKKYKKNTDVLLAMSKAYYEVKDTANARIMAENALKATSRLLATTVVQQHSSISRPSISTRRIPKVTTSMPTYIRR